ncbi:MAG: ABC transporter ATP-binding protein [Clostridia bacterium]|nr:ABC transporter ATP-binding protein [Clostridia bacterium]
MIKVENVTKKYGSHVAVNNISFTIEDGEIVGFLGPNGAGKTTTMNMLTGFIESSSGEIEINGYDVSKKAKKAKKEIGYMPETTPLYNELTPKEFINYMAELKGVSKKERKEEVQRILKEVNIEDVQNKLIRNLSRGYRQRVSLASALVGNPKVLILDEPTVGLDPKQVVQIRNLIKSLGKDHTVILSSHILSEISQICEKVIIINKGNLIAVDTPENLENKVKDENSLLVTIEENNGKVEEIAKKINNLKAINLIKKLPDGTKQYSITSKNNADIRKEIFEVFAKNGITIFELKKSEATLEEAFINLIDEKPKKEEKGGKK